METETDIVSELPFPQNETQPTDVESSDDEHFEFGNEEFCLIKLSSYSLNEFRLIKNAIEDALVRKCKKIDSIEKPLEEEKFVCYYQNYSIDKIGKSVTQGETGIAEGWNVPIYENEFQNLLGLPFHEDNSLDVILRIKRPRLECFNCLATNHRVTDCPVKIDDDRIKIHRKIFTSQSMQAQEHAELYSTRYTSDAKDNRGFKPGQVSSQLKQALGVRENQIPPYVYLMRELGYPIGWLLEAQCKKSDLELVNEQDQKELTPEKAVIEYDADKIIGYPGFNEPIPTGCVDESDRYSVERYNTRLSKEEFMKTLNIRKKRSFHRKVSKPESEDDAEKSSESIEDGMIEETSQETECKAEHGTAVVVIQGTPVVENMSEVKQVPTWEKFSENICEHKPFDMENINPTGSYQNIVKITREFKNKTHSSSQ